MITHDWKHIPRSDGVREHWECRCCGQLCSLPVKEKCERWKQRAEKAEREAKQWQQDYFELNRKADKLGDDLDDAVDRYEAVKRDAEQLGRERDEALAILRLLNVADHTSPHMEKRCAVCEALLWGTHTADCPLAKLLGEEPNTP